MTFIIYDLLFYFRTVWRIILITLHLKLKRHPDNQYVNAFLVQYIFALSFCFQQYCSGAGQGHCGEDLTDLSPNSSPVSSLIAKMSPLSEVSADFYYTFNYNSDFYVDLAHVYIIYNFY